MLNDHNDNNANRKSAIGQLKISPSSTEHVADPLHIVDATLHELPQKGGEEGESELPPLPPSNAEFVATVIGDVADGARAAVCSLANDPEASRGWPAVAADDVDRQCPFGRNNYVNCSSFVLDEEGELAVLKDRASAFHFLMLDDVGTKGDRAKLDGFVATWEIETSPGNFQVGIKLSEPIHDQRTVAALQNAVVAAGLSDAGAKGVGRWARLPHGINGKEKHLDADGLPFRCRLTVWNPAVTYTVDELVDALALNLLPPLPSFNPPVRQDVGEWQGDDVFTPRPSQNPVLSALKARGLQVAVAASRNPQLKFIVGLLLLTGARVSELLNAEWKHVNLERRVWLIPTSKTGKSRHVPLSQPAIDLIRQVPTFKDCPYLLPNPETKLPFVSIKHGWQTARDEAKLPDLRIHDLRHSAASFMINAGVDLFAVGRVLGHADHKSTMRYSHLANDTLLAAVEAGAKKMRGSPALR